MSRIAVDDDTRARIVELFESGLPVMQVSSTVGVNTRAVRRVLQDAGVASPLGPRRYREPVPEASLASAHETVLELEEQVRRLAADIARLRETLERELGVRS